MGKVSVTSLPNKIITKFAILESISVVIFIANNVGSNGDNSYFSGGHYEDGDQSWNDYSGRGDIVQRRQKALRHHLTKCFSRMCQSFTKEV